MSCHISGAKKVKIQCSLPIWKIVGNKSILVVDDDPMNQQLVRALLAEQGYDLRSARSAPEALRVLTAFTPELILMDIQMPGMSGLELTRQLRTNPEMKSANIVALTAYGRKEDEQNCLNAGCDGYIEKPIDTATFPAAVRSIIDKKTRAVPNIQSDVGDLLRGMRNNFIAESLAELAELVAPDVPMDKTRLVRTLHRWAGIASTLGMPAVTDQARKTEGFVESAEPVEAAAVTAALQELRRLIAEAAAAPAFELALPNEIVKTLSGKRIALAGFSDPEARRIAQVVDRAQCFTLVIEAPPGGLTAAMLERFDIVLLNLGGASGSICHKNTSPGLDKPVLLVGSRACISDSVDSIETATRDFLTKPWDTEELLVRCCKLLLPDLKNPQLPTREGAAQVVIADDDPAIGALLTATLRRTGAECRLARNGAETLALLREVVPDVVILDVNMPGMDGFEVLANMHADHRTERIPVVLLTARQQETDVLKGFSCGASDYITKPFNPMEVTARIARYLPRKKA
jgi:DNA-binding response OmpR family regulator